jgi:hypothetical protein
VRPSDRNSDARGQARIGRPPLRQIHTAAVSIRPLPRSHHRRTDKATVAPVRPSPPLLARDTWRPGVALRQEVNPLKPKRHMEAPELP